MMFALPIFTPVALAAGAVCLLIVVGFSTLFVMAQQPRQRRKDFGRHSPYEALEARLPLDTQIGNVAMPYNDYLSAAIYDANGQQIRTLLEHVPTSAGSVAISWDGRDDLGRLVYQSGGYTWKAVASATSAVEQGLGSANSQFNGQVGLDGSLNESGGQIDALAINSVGGMLADVGGTFARNTTESYFGDTTLSQAFTLNDAISGSGSFYYSANQALTADGEFFVGHFSSSTAANRREFIGMEVQEGDVDGQLKVRARMYRPNGMSTNGAMSDWLTLPSSGQFYFSYVYDPSFEADASHAGPEGKVTLNVFTDGHIFDQTLVAIFEAGHRDSGATFDSFGMGIAAGATTSSDPAKTAKALIDDVTYSGNTGGVDFSTNPNWTGSGNLSSGNNFGWSQTDSADGSVYLLSYGEEGGLTLRRYGQDGTLIWSGGGFANVGIAVNATHVFVSRRVGNQDLVVRLLARDGSSAPFTQAAGGQIVFNNDAFDPRAGTDHPGGKYTPDEYRQQFSTWGMAADSRRVWVSNYRKDRVEVYSAVTGLKLGEFTAESPLGIAIEADGATSGTIWVANNSDRVSRMTYTADGLGVYTFTEDTSRRITGLSEPSGLSIGGTSNHLFVGEKGTGKIREYDITQTPPALAGLGSSFGSLQPDGPITSESQFYFIRWAGVAVDRQGIINVIDDNRVMRYFGESGGGHSAGDLDNYWMGIFGPAPVDSFNYTADGKFTLIDGAFETEIDPEYAGGPRPGWLGDGSWRLVGRYFDEVAGVRRTLNDNGTLRDYRFAFGGPSQTATIYALGPSGARLSAIVGMGWTGANRLQVPQGGRFNWTDTDGDGQIDWGGGGSGTSGEVTWTVPLGQNGQPNPYVLNPGWVDYSGNVWAVIDKDIVKVPLQGFDAQHNPIYSWGSAVTVAPFQDDDYDFMPRFVRIAANGDIYALGTTKFFGNLSPTGNSEIHGGDWLARYDSSGNRKLLMPIVFDNTDNLTVAMAFDENDPNSEYFYVGVGEGASFYVRQYTKDGLLVSTLDSTGAIVDTGWIDHGFGLNAFTHPVTGKTYVFGEDIVIGRTIRYRLDGLNTVSRQQGNFNWTVAHNATSYWQFQDNLNDSVGTNTGAFNGGSPIYATTGAVGKAIDLDGVDDYVDLPLVNDPAAYTIAAWVKPTDTTSVNIINRADANPSSAYYQLRINAAGKFEHTIVDNSISGTTRTVTGATTVNPDIWYHVAIVAQNNGMMRLYVNGVEEGTAQSGITLLGNGDRFRLGTSTTYAGTFGYFDGLIDDLRIYEVPLSLAEIQALSAVATTVTIAASDSRANEANSDTGKFTITRSNSIGNLTVNYSVSGSATSGSDYTALSGSVIIASGQLSATVTVTPSNDAALDPGETVILTLSASPNYLTTTPSNAMVVIFDDEAVGDPGWIGAGNTTSGNNYGWSYNTNFAGGAVGEIGGTIARNDNESYYADVNLSRTFSLNDTLTASGKLTLFGQNNTDGEWLLGHISSAVDTDDSILGIEFMENSATSVRFKARVGRPDSTLGASESAFVTLPNGVYNFTYTYNPNLGSFGRLTARIFNGSYDQTVSVDLTSTVRNGGSTFDAFGMGIKNRPGTGDDANRTIKMFIDDASYTGFQGAPPTVSVNASQNAQEQNAGLGMFTITRTGTNGNLVVNYTISGTASNGADYATLTGSVSILNGASSAIVNIVSIDDALVEGDETVILTLSSATPYFVGGPNSATLTIVDNDSTLPGDFDSDGDVDGADFVTWQTHFPTATGTTLATGDSDGDGDVDGADFVAWQTHFPTSPAPGVVEPASGSSSASSLPSAESNNSAAGSPAAGASSARSEGKSGGGSLAGGSAATITRGTHAARHSASPVVPLENSSDAARSRALSSLSSSANSPTIALKRTATAVEPIAPAKQTVLSPVAVDYWLETFSRYRSRSMGRTSSAAAGDLLDQIEVN